MTSEQDNRRPVIVLGAGGHARVLLDSLRLTGRDLIGIADPSADVDSELYGLRVLGDDSVVDQYSPEAVELVNAVGAMPGNDLRQRLQLQMQDKGFRFASVIHPSAVVAADVSLEQGVQIMAGAVIQPGVSLGTAVIVNTRASIDHDCVVDEFCHLAPGVTLSGNVVVKRGSHIGTGAVVIQGIAIGRNCVIAAGTAVYRDIANDTKYIPRSEGELRRELNE